MKGDWKRAEWLSCKQKGAFYKMKGERASIIPCTRARCTKPRSERVGERESEWDSSPHLRKVVAGEVGFIGEAVMSRASCIFIFKTSLHFANKRRDEGGKNKEAIVREKAGEIQTGAFWYEREEGVRSEMIAKESEKRRAAYALCCALAAYTLFL